MTFLTLNNLTMLRMTLGTAKERMFGGAFCQQVISVPMATGTCLPGYVLWIDNLKGLVGWMAGQALSLGHLLCVRLMALHTFRSISMLRMMTGMAIEFRMLRDIGLHFFVYFGVTHVASVFQGTVCGDVKWCVGFRVTCNTLCQLRSMNFFVTCLTFWQNIFVFHLIRTIDVEFLMAFHTVYPVFTAFGPYQLIEVWMTAPTLFRCQWLNALCVYSWKIFFRNRLRRGWRRCTSA
jgi:hypothetical protein